MELAALVIGFVALILLGAPMGIAMALVPIVYILVTDDLPLATVPYQMYEALSHTALVAVPFFMLTGELMNSTQLTGRLLALSRELVGRIRGGLAQTNVVASMLFAGMNGSAVADTAAVGGIMIPAMKKAGYSAAFSAALTAVASTIGGVIPPSIMMILLASTMSMSVGALFAAGILPGLLIGLLLMVVTYVLAVKRRYERYEMPFNFRALWRAFIGAWAALTIPLVILGGMLFGVFSTIEAGAITALVALIIGGLVYRTLTVKELGQTLVRTVKVTSAVFIILAASGPFAWLLNRIGALDGLESFFALFVHNQFLFAVVLVLFILVIGTILEPVPCIVVLSPTLVEACKVAGFHEVQAALVLTVGFLIGAVSPPVGVCYFTAAKIAGERLEAVALELWPLLLAEISVLFLILFLPWLTLGMPRLFGLV
jgi:tripartite ATP-independent transporter DctM subunit